MPLPYRTYIAGALRRDGVLRASSLQMPGDERTVVVRDIHFGPFEGLVHVRGGRGLGDESGGRARHHAPPTRSARIFSSTLAFLWAAACLPRPRWSARRRSHCLSFRAPCARTARKRIAPADNDTARARLAQVCITAENKVAGAQTGGLDQTASVAFFPGAGAWWISETFD